jgi:hypothetical protein
MNLLEYRSNVFSQKGEDGILTQMLEVLGLASTWCVEFGAGDGCHLSNTRNLILSRGWSAVLIEANPARFAGLRATYAERPDIVCLERIVGLDPATNLDAIIATTPIPKEFALLSIDIDGNDYHVWEDLTVYRPSIVVIEFNPTIPNAVDYVQPRDPEVYHGNSLRALVRLGRQKGYELVCSTGLNGIFVRSKLFPRFAIADNSIETLNQDQPLVTHLFVCYDGTIKLAGNRTLVWHRVAMHEEKMQALPSAERVFRGRLPNSPQSGNATETA